MSFNPDRRGFLKGALALAGASALAAVPGEAAAVTDMYHQASSHAETTEDLAIYVEGRSSEYTNNQLANYWKASFEGAGVSCRVFTANPNRIGPTFDFIIGDQLYGTHTFFSAQEAFPTVVRQYREAYPHRFASGPNQQPSG